MFQKTDMRILLLGEYSNLHWTLAEGLRMLGHEVTVASNGDRFKNYKRDVNLVRKSYGIIDSIKYAFQLAKSIYKFKNYDIVQLINPIFLDVKPDKNLKIYKHLKTNNKKIFLGSFGRDYFEIKASLNQSILRYSEFHNGKESINSVHARNAVNEWFGTDKEILNKEIANTCNGIIACLYEYYVSYLSDYKDKLTYIPEPINLNEIKFRQREVPDKVRFFIGIQSQRTQLKGTDILYKVLLQIKDKYPDECIINKAESLPYDEYVKLFDSSDVLLDQLYSYTPAMNAFLAMAKGLVVLGGGESEAYEILEEKENKPVINVLPDEKDIFEKLEWIIKNKHLIPELSLKSRQFVEKHHDYVKIARQYINFWNSK